MNKDLIEKGWTYHSRHPGTFKDLEAYKLWRGKTNLLSSTSENLCKKKVSYEKWRKGFSKDKSNFSKNNILNTNELTEGSGVAYRLKYPTKILKELYEIFISEEMKDVLINRFSLEIKEKCFLDAGFQKYLHGYEISPHPNIREKALTWMLNLNTDQKSEQQNYHCHFMKFKNSKKYIYKVWEENTHLQRQWVPWDWCQTNFLQKKNNSITIFSPYSHTIHAVKASYDDLDNQRTQLYGNIWYEDIYRDGRKSKYLSSTFEDLKSIEKV